MRKFKRIKTLKEIKAQCKRLSLSFDDYLYRKHGHDHVCIRGGGAMVLYSSPTGNFFGTTDKGVQFDSKSDEHEAEPWFQTLLEFFYA